MPTLFEISDELLTLLALTESSDSPEQHRLIDQWLADNQNDLYEKIDSYCGLIRKLEGESKIVKEEAGRLAGRAKSTETLAKTLRDRLAYCLAQAVPNGIKTTRNTVAVSLTKSKLRLAEGFAPADLPTQFQIKTVMITPNWEEIVGAIREGEVVARVVATAEKPFLRIM